MARNFVAKLVINHTPFCGSGDIAFNGDHISPKGFIIAVPDFRIDFLRTHAGVVGLPIYFRQLLQLCLGCVADGNTSIIRPLRQGKLRLRPGLRGAGDVAVLGFGRLHHLAEGL